jgi:hypothetical protein
MTIIKEASWVNDMSSEISTLRLIIQSIVWGGILFALPFAGAGTFAWPEGWAYILIISLFREEK